MHASVYDISKKLKRQHKTSNPFELADILGIDVSYKAFTELKGVYYVLQKNPYIVLSEDLDEHMTKVVMFHEIGHHVLHRRMSSAMFQEFCLFDMTSITEREANIFAADYMITDDDVLDGAEYGYTSEMLAKSFFVPHELMLIKIKDMNTRGYSLKIDYEPRANFLAF